MTGLGFIVIEWDQASGRPGSLATTFTRLLPAPNWPPTWLAARRCGWGRRESYTVARVEGLDNG